MPLPVFRAMLFRKLIAPLCRFPLLALDRRPEAPKPRVPVAVVSTIRDIIGHDDHQGLLYI